MSLLSIIAGNSYWIINKNLAKKVGLDAALLLSDLAQAQLYWNEKLNREDYFYKVESDIEEDTTLSSHKQRKARATLSKAGILKVKRRGVPAKIFYFIDESCIKNLLLNFLTTGSKKNEELEVKNFNVTNNREIIIDSNNITDIEEEASSIPYLEELKQILLLFQELTGVGFKIPSPSKVKNYGAYKLASAIFNKGYSLEDILSVIKFKYQNWKDQKKMLQYINYNTILRGKNFDKYFQELQITNNLNNTLNNNTDESRNNNSKTLQNKLESILQNCSKEGYF
jgi:uncharacterized phage protein (TIGR02220 family)